MWDKIEGADPPALAKRVQELSNERVSEKTEGTGTEGVSAELQAKLKQLIRCEVVRVLGGLDHSANFCVSASPKPSLFARHALFTSLARRVHLVPRSFVLLCGPSVVQTPFMRTGSDSEGEPFVCRRSVRYPLNVLGLAFVDLSRRSVFQLGHLPSVDAVSLSLNEYRLAPLPLQFHPVIRRGRGEVIAPMYCRMMITPLPLQCLYPANVDRGLRCAISPTCWMPPPNVYSPVLLQRIGRHALHEGRRARAKVQVQQKDGRDAQV